MSDTKYKSIKIGLIDLKSHNLLAFYKPQETLVTTLK